MRYFCRLADKEARRAIFKIHLKLKEQKHTPSDELLRKTEGFSGAEIEAIVNEACFLAHNDYYFGKKENDNVTAQNLIDATDPIVPLSTTMKETIEKLRQWADTDAAKQMIVSHQKLKIIKTSLNYNRK